MWKVIEDELRTICEARRLRLEVVEHHRAPAVPCAPWLQRAVIAGIAATGDAEPMGLWSRAGHDAMAVASITDVGMLFLRCFDGISHHPAEDVREDDVAAGLDALTEAVLAVARTHREGTHADR
jgi:allantoate deiminase